MTSGPEDEDPTLDGGSSPDAETRTGSDGLQTSTLIGSYRLLRLIGTGGMGEVWLADQTAPVRRQVALKVIKAGMDTKQVIALMRKAYDDKVRILGASHPYSLTAAINLAGIHAQAGRKSDAIGWVRRAVDDGWKDPDVIRAAPEMSALQGDPEFEDLLARAKKSADAAAQAAGSGAQG